MAKKVVVQLTDDVDGKAIADGKGGTVRFSLDDDAYEIDLSDANFVKLREALQPFVDAARPVSRREGRRGLTSRTRSSGARRDLGVVRAWAEENGHKVSDRGRVPTSVLDAYDAAH